MVFLLSLRDLSEMFLERGVTFTYEAVREWERRFAPLLTEQLRTNRRGQAVREMLGDHVLHRTNKYLNNRLEQDYRGVKQRYYPMHGFGSFDSAARFCCAFDELRNYLRPRATGEAASPSEQRRAFLDRLTALKEMLRAIS